MSGDDLSVRQRLDQDAAEKAAADSDAVPENAQTPSTARPRRRRKVVDAETGAVQAAVAAPVVVPDEDPATEALTEMALSPEVTDAAIEAEKTETENIEADKDETRTEAAGAAEAAPRKHWDRHAIWAGVKTRVSLIPAPIRWLVGIILVALIGIIIFLANPNWDWARGFLTNIIAGKTHRPVKIDGHLRVHLFSFTPSATLTGLHIGQPDWGGKAGLKDNMADVDAIAVNVKALPGLVGHIVLPRLEITKPVVLLYQDNDGKANWDFSSGADAGKPVKLPLIQNFIINDGHLTVTSIQRKLKFTGTVYAHEKADSGSQAFGLTGQGSLNDKIFQMNATGGPLLNVRSNVPYPFDASVRAGDTVITAKGRVLHPFNLGQVDAAMTLRGDNLADLYYLTGLTLPDTSRYSLSAFVTRNDMVYTIDKINGRVGGSDLEGLMKVDTRDHGRPNLTGDLSSRLLDFKDLGSLLGATNANKPTAPKLAAAPQATVGARRLLPDVPLDVERVRGMDAKVRYRALAVKANGIALRQVTLGVTLDHGLLVLDPIDLSFPQGRLTGLARIDARGAVQKDSVDLALTGLRVQDVAPKIQGQPPLEGVINARTRLSGTGNTIHKAAGTSDGEFAVIMPGGTIRQSFAELMGIDATKGLFLLLSKNPRQTDIRCAVATFSVKNGMMQAQNIVFDTGVVVVNGSGGLNLNDESMKLIFKGKAKKFRLIHINAPIVIGGHLSAPTFGIDPGPAVVQGGIAAALSTVSAGLLALPFANLGGADDANCAGLLSQAHAQGAQISTRPVAHKTMASPVKK